jgi:hypothetical protein
MNSALHDCEKVTLKVQIFSAVAREVAKEQDVPCSLPGILQRSVGAPFAIRGSHPKGTWAAIVPVQILMPCSTVLALHIVCRSPDTVAFIVH